MGVAGVSAADLIMELALSRFLVSAGMCGGGSTGGLPGCEASAHDADRGESFVGGGNAAARKKNAVDLGAGE